MSLAEYLEKAAHAANNKQWETATEHYASACAAYAETHDGEEDPDILFRYGHSLFQFAREQVNLLNTENVAKPNAQSDNIELAPLPDIGGDAEEEEQEEAEAEQKKDDIDEKDDPEAEVEALDDNVDDFTAAWQIIDLCRVLYGRQLEVAKDKRPLQQKMAQVYSLLGEISIDDDMYGQAAQDFEDALKIKEQVLEPNDRLLSEAHYMCGLAHEMKGHELEDKKVALEHMKAAVEIGRKAGVDKATMQDLKQKAHDLSKEIESYGAEEAVPVDKLEQMMSARGGLAQDLGSLVKKKKKRASVEPVGVKKQKIEGKEDKGDEAKEGEAKK